MTVKNPSTRKSLYQFTQLLDAKNKTFARQLGAENLSARQSNQEVCCVPVYQIGEDIQKSMNRSGKLFIIGLYNILRLYSPQFPIIDLKYLFSVTLNYIWFQNWYCKCLLGKFTIAWLVPQKRVELGRRKILTIILSLMILHHVPFCHPNSKRYLHGTR